MYFDYKSYPFVAPPEMRGAGARHPVAVLGGGPTGMTLALGLARRGIRSVLLEADDTVCQGSRATCISRRSLEIFRQFGVDRAYLDKGLAWTGGRSFYRDEVVLRFSMPTDAYQMHPPMINLQQCYTEQFILDGIEASPEVDLRWRSRAVDVSDRGDHAVVRVATQEGEYDLEADWVVACDGARSAARRGLGLKLQGTSYEGRYVIVDIKLASRHPVVERRVWFDPPTNPGSTVIMHRQPDDIWRVDYQLRDDEDPDEEVKPERVIPRVRSHLRWIGEPDDSEIEWISIYRAQSLTLERYRHGRILFAGEAAHLLPIFGVRGLNSCVDDAHNLAWKLAYVLEGRATPALLDSYSDERVAAARENMAQANKSTYFMTPPSRGHAVMRDAALSLAVSQPFASALVNPRQTLPVCYPESPLNFVGGDSGMPPPRPAAGDLFINLPGRAMANDPRDVHLIDVLGTHFALLIFAPDTDAADIAARAAHVLADVRVPCRTIAIVPAGRGPDVWNPETTVVEDAYGVLFERYRATPGTALLLRPDNYVVARWADVRDGAAFVSLPGALRRAVCAA